MSYIYIYMYIYVYIYIYLIYTPWTVAHQAPLSMGFSQQEYWRRLPFPLPEDLPDQGIKLRSGRFFTN